MKRSGLADLPLYGGTIPSWLFEKMAKLSFAVVEAIILEYGQQEFLRRLSDPFWFQSFGAAIGMNWNASGVTTAVMSALKKSINPHSKKLGIYICGGKGKYSLQTPSELIEIGNRTGLDGNYLALCSKLSAKVDNTAIQDGFQLYLHNFVVTNKGDWAIIQQGMKPDALTARRYHWNSTNIQSFIEEPHTAICGENQGQILNLVDKNAQQTQQGILAITNENPDKMLAEIKRIVLPSHKNICAENVDLKRLGSILWLAQKNKTEKFEDLLLLNGLGPRTLQSLTLVSEIIHGTPSRFTDPARFAFAHGGKSGHPFPILTGTYDETIYTLKSSIEKAKLGETEKHDAIKKLTKIAQTVEKDFIPNNNFEILLKKGNEDAWKYGGRTTKRFLKPPDSE